MTISLDIGMSPFTILGDWKTLRLHIGFGIGMLHITKESLCHVAEYWFMVSQHAMTKEQREILEEGVKSNVDFNVLLTRLNQAARKYCDDD